MLSNRIQALGNKAAELSNKIHRGETKGFVDTLKTLLESYRIQKQIDTLENFNDPIWDECIEEVGQALSIYRKHVHLAELAAAKEMREQGLTNFADALESEEYCDLAY
jgi:hypothetical protein